MITKKRMLVVGGLVAVLAVPAGVAVAAVSSTGSNSPAAATQPHGPGAGRMGNGVGDPDNCPVCNSAEMQQWRDLRADRQKLSPADRQQLAQQMRDRMSAHRAASPHSS